MIKFKNKQRFQDMKYKKNIYLQYLKLIRKENLNMAT